MAIGVVLLKDGMIYCRKDCKVLKRNWSDQQITAKTIEKQGRRWRLLQWLWLKIRI